MLFLLVKLMTDVRECEGEKETNGCEGEKGSARACLLERVYLKLSMKLP